MLGLRSGPRLRKGTGPKRYLPRPIPDSQSAGRPPDLAAPETELQKG
jgi:hypothetical protein